MGKKEKRLLSHETIYKIMQWLPILVTGIFFVKNVVEKNLQAMLVIGICLCVFSAVLLFMKMRNVRIYIKELVLAVFLPILIFIISLYSGEAYSDDFPMFLAVIGMTGLYLEPKFTKIQIVESLAMLVVMYILHPEKAESLSQYIMCTVIFGLAAGLFYQVIKRGRSFIELGEERAKQAEMLLESIRSMGIELQQDFDNSSTQIDYSAQNLQSGSVVIAQGAGEMSESCDAVHDKIQETEEQIGALNDEVRKFELALAENKRNIEAMNEQVQSVSDIIKDSDAVFMTMQEQMNEIASVAKQINDISFNLTILSLNASVEAARAGEAGAGFVVVSNSMRELSENSDMFSEQVAEVVEQLLKRVANTAKRFEDSRVAMEQSEKTMRELRSSFEQLTEQFEYLYGNIEQQNRNVSEIDAIFNHLNARVSDMRSSSQDNQKAVDAIVEAMDIYKENITRVVKNTQNI